jgi:hypothetical protein
MVLGRVVHARIDDALVHPRMHVDPVQLRAVGRMGGDWYARTTDRFERARG